MKKRVLSIPAVLLISILSSCVQAKDDGMIDPGDKIDSFLITTGVDEEPTYGWDLNNFVQQGDEDVYSIELPVGTKMNVSSAIYSTGRTPLDDKWKGHTYNLTSASPVCPARTTRLFQGKDEYNENWQAN